MSTITVIERTFISYEPATKTNPERITFSNPGNISCGVYVPPESAYIEGAGILESLANFINQVRRAKALEIDNGTTRSNSDIGRDTKETATLCNGEDISGTVPEIPPTEPSDTSDNSSDESVYL